MIARIDFALRVVFWQFHMRMDAENRFRGILAALAAMNGVTAKGQQSSSGVLTLKSNSQLVFMDVTVSTERGIRS